MIVDWLRNKNLAHFSRINLVFFFFTGGHSTFFGLLNTFVHIIMYSYYLLAALGPNVQKYLWWKKYLTTLQMLQFLAIMVHAFQLLFIDCNYPKAFVWWIGMHAVMFFFLFKEFYKQQYTKPSKQKVIHIKLYIRSRRDGRHVITFFFRTILLAKCRVSGLFRYT